MNWELLYSYNFLNLPSKITHTNTANSLQYVYAANGSKVQMIQGTETTNYLGNFQYTLAGTAVSSQILANEEGYYDFVNSRYVYQYKDHLGNIRISYTRNTAGGTTILEENNYYAFGLKHSGYNTGDTTNNKFKYLYNSKELQSSGNLDYGWRQYMPDLGRWFGMDALSESYHMASPYAYVMNNLVSFFDPNGMLSQPFMDEITNSPGGTIWSNNGKGFSNNWGGMMDYDGGSLNYQGYSYMPYEGSADGPHFTIPVTVTGKGKGTASTWNEDGNYFPNVMAMMNGFMKASENWTHRVKAEDMAWHMTGVRADGPVNYIGSAGDPAGVFDIGGQVMSTWKPENRYLAMGAGILAAIALRKPGLATAEMQAEKKLASGLAEDFVTVRHHTSNSAVNAIKKSGSINVSSPTPFGVDVEVAPFVKPSKVNLGQAAGGNRGGGYVEFTVPKSGITPTPYIGGVGNSGRIIVEGRMQLDIRTLNPKYVKRWWPF